MMDMLRTSTYQIIGSWIPIEEESGFQLISARQSQRFMGNGAGRSKGGS